MKMYDSGDYQRPPTVRPDDPDAQVILVVEDDVGLLRLVQKRLRRAGFTVTGATTGAEAVQRVRDDPPMLMLLDYRLPDMSGQEVLETLRETRSLVPFVIITGHGDERVAVELMKLGARDYLSKDTHLLELLPQVVGQVVKRLVTEADLTEARQQRRELEELLRGFLESATDGFVLLDEALRVKDHNSVAAAKLGWQSGVAQGRALIEAFPQLAGFGGIEPFKEVLTTGEPHAVDVVIPRHGGPAIYLTIKVFRVGAGLGLILTDITGQVQSTLARERLIADLQQALEKVRTLSGFLPICAWCKKIRDDQGYWNQVEEYIRKNADVEFSHSICPDCNSRMEKQAG